MSLNEQFRTRAAQCRAWAMEMNNRDKRRQLLAMAEQYDHLILQIEHLDMQGASHPLEALAA
jgi:hypothetical protein